MTVTVLLKGPQATAALGRCLSQGLRPGDLVLLSGDLGTGKTCLVRAVAAGLAVPEREVTSPSFAIVHEHLHGRLPLVHCDLYRLSGKIDLEETGLTEYLDGKAVVMVEWGEFLDDPAVLDALHIRLRWLNEASRKAEIDGSPGTWDDRIEHLSECLRNFPEQVDLE